MNSDRLQGKVAWISGGTSGIGEAAAELFAEEGAAVAIVGRRGELGQEIADRIAKAGGQAIATACDVAKADQVRDSIEKTVAAFGRLDIVVNNAGMAMSGTSQSLTVDDWDHGMAVLLRAAFVGTKFAAPHLKRSDQGRIIHITSVWATRGGCSPVYTAAKAGLDNLARDSAMELAKDSVTVNTIRPGFVETAIQDYLTPEQIDAFRDRHPLPRFGTPRDIGRAVVFLASDDGSWITGETLTVDGGLTCPL